MATFKSLLEKAMLRLGSRGARQANSAVDVLYSNLEDSGNNYRKYTAPSDGYIALFGTSANNYGYLWLECQQVRASGTAPTGQYAGVALSCSKGMSIFLTALNMKIETVTLRFISSVGGGVVNFFARCLMAGGRYAYH